MFTQMSRRPYRMARRAESRDETRARIVDAAIALHEEVGPKATTISAIAERAGVQRLTVYRHFPDDASMLQACSSDWYERNPFPDLNALEGSGLQGCRDGLAALYRYYSGAHRMIASVQRDAPDMPVLREPNRPFVDFLARLHGKLLERASPPLSREPFASLTLGHAIAFTTWQSLEQAGLSDEAKADLVIEWLR
jgi:AcrR family transcriptional regulator